MVKCISSTRFNLKADILRIGEDGKTEIPLSDQGEHKITQDPRSGAIRREWVPVKGGPIEENFSIPCDVRTILDGGIRVAGTTERFEKTYDNVDFATMFFPAKYTLSKRDRVTNVRNRKGQVIWVEEELDAVNGLYPATVFDVLGVNPITDYAGNLIEFKALLARVDLNAY